MSVKPKIQVRAYRYCCDSLYDAIRWSLLEIDVVYEGLNLGHVGLDKLGWKAGNLLTGETYDPKTMSMSMDLDFCPFCGERLVEKSFLGGKCPSRSRQ